MNVINHKSMSMPLFRTNPNSSGTLCANAPDFRVKQGIYEKTPGNFAKMGT